jgi:hypothetical protein
MGMQRHWTEPSSQRVVGYRVQSNDQHPAARCGACLVDTAPVSTIAARPLRTASATKFTELDQSVTTGLGRASVMPDEAEGMARAGDSSSGQGMHLAQSRTSALRLTALLASSEERKGPSHCPFGV